MNKVVHFMRWCLPSTASFIRNQIVYHQRYEPAVVYTQPKPGAFYDDLHKRGSTLYPLHSTLEKKFYGFTRRLSPAAKRRVIDFVRKQNPKVLHVHYGVDCLVYADIIRTLGIPACVSFYGYDCTEFPRRFYGFGKTLLEKGVFQNPSVKAVLAMSDDMKADLISAGCPEEKIIVHYYGIEAEQFSIQREDTQKDVIKFLIISGLHPKKGHTYLIEAFAAMSRSIEKNVELHIVGAGPLYPSLEEAISKTGLSNIFLHGHVNYGSEKHREYLREADVFVHPSVTSPTGDKEGIPGAVIEAMASGLPVITTYHAGIPSVVQDDVHALLVKEKDVMALQMAMTRLANDPVYRARIARDGQKHASTKLDVIPKEIELEEIYDLISINNKTLKANTIA